MQSDQKKKVVVLGETKDDDRFSQEILDVFLTYKITSVDVGRRRQRVQEEQALLELELHRS